MLSSAKDRQEETFGCVEGGLIKIEEEVVKGEKAIEVCLAEDNKGEKGEDQDLTVWEEAIKEWSEAREFRVESDKREKNTKGQHGADEWGSGSG